MAILFSEDRIPFQPMPLVDHQDFRPGWNRFRYQQKNPSLTHRKAEVGFEPGLDPAVSVGKR